MEIMKADKVEMIAATCTTNQMTGYVDYKRSQFDRIATLGFIKPLAPNVWPIIETFQGVIRYLRDEGRKTSKSAVQSRVQAARVKEIELRIAERSHVVVDIEECSALVDDVFGNMRAELSGIPAMITRDLKLRSEIERTIDECLNRYADRLELRAAALRETGQTPSRPITIPS
jgi:hypothetical protein